MIIIIKAIIGVSKLNVNIFQLIDSLIFFFIRFYTHAAYTFVCVCVFRNSYGLLFR